MKTIFFIKSLILSLVFLAPQVVQACSVCRSGFEDNEVEAYLQITALLAFLPIIGGCALGYWIYKKYKNYEVE